MARLAAKSCQDPPGTREGFTEARRPRSVARTVTRCARARAVQDPSSDEISPMAWITRFLSLDSQAEEDRDFYVSVFRNSRAGATVRFGDAGPEPKGTVMTAFELDGHLVRHQWRHASGGRRVLAAPFRRRRNAGVRLAQGPIRRLLADRDASAAAHARRCRRAPGRASGGGDHEDDQDRDCRARARVRRILGISRGAGRAPGGGSNYLRSTAVSIERNRWASSGLSKRVLERSSRPVTTNSARTA